MKSSKIRQAAAKVGRFTLDAIETLFSALIAVILYCIYVPFGIGRAIFDRKAVRDFYGDVIFTLDALADRMKRRKGGAA